jgi:nicotinamide mononucleotide adenylyltransferase
MNKYNLFIVRFQSPHKGHQAIFDKFLSQGKPILIAIRDVPTDEKNPLSAYDVHHLMRELYADNPLVKVIVFPDIASVNYGRGVGYEVNEIEVDSTIASISATEIRNRIKDKDESWKEFVDEKIWSTLQNFLEQK